MAVRMPSLKSLQITNAEEGVEKREHSYTVGEDVNWYSHSWYWRIVRKFLKKTKYRLSI